jgi:hypothetical protein
MIIHGEDLYRIWAKEDALWSRWAKPVLFAQLRPVQAEIMGKDDWKALDTNWAPPPATRTAIIVNLPGAESVVVGLALAALGYWPVPLYNACSDMLELVHTGEIVSALILGAPRLQQMRIPPDAPPAFLIDSNRAGVGEFELPGKFDNRWVVFPQDFPSANFLQSQGIQAVLLIQRHATQPENDLIHVLLRWQEAGIPLWFKNMASLGPFEKLTVTKPWNFKMAWYRVLALAGLRRSSAGGFGAIIPESSSVGGFG